MKLASISNFKLAWSMLRFHAQFLQTCPSPAQLLSFMVLSTLGLELSKIARFAKSATPAFLSH